MEPCLRRGNSKEIACGRTEPSKTSEHCFTASHDELVASDIVCVPRFCTHFCLSLEFTYTATTSNMARTWCAPFKCDLACNSEYELADYQATRIPRLACSNSHL